MKWLKSILNRLRKEFEREIIEINCRLNLKKKFQRENQKIYQLKGKKSINFISRKIYQRRNSQLPFTFFCTKLIRLCFSQVQWPLKPMSNMNAQSLTMYNQLDQKKWLLKPKEKKCFHGLLKVRMLWTLSCSFPAKLRQQTETSYTLFQNQ